MAKNFGKLVLFGSIIGAAAAGTYYYLQKKDDIPSKDIDDIDDFDDFDEDLDEDLDNNVSAAHNPKTRSYVSLNFENTKELIGEKVIETLDKTKEKFVEFNVPEKLDKAKEFVEEITFPNGESQKDPSQASVSETYTTIASAPDEEAEPVVYSDKTEEPKAETEEFYDDSQD